MEKSKIEIFMSPMCPHCPVALELANELAEERGDVDVERINMLLPEGEARAKQFNVYSTPTVFVKGPKHNEILGIVGVPSRERLNELIDISQGKKNIEDKLNLFSRMWDKIKSLD